MDRLPRGRNSNLVRIEIDGSANPGYTCDSDTRDVANPGAKDSAVANEAAATDLSDDAAPTSEGLRDKEGRQWIAILVAAALFVVGGVGGALVAGLLKPLVGLLG